MISYSPRAQEDLESLADPQRRGGVLVIVDEARRAMIEACCAEDVRGIGDRARRALRQHMQGSEYRERDYHRGDTAITGLQLDRITEMLVEAEGRA